MGDEVAKLATDGEKGWSIDDLPRAVPPNPLNYNESEITENLEWARLLRLRHPDLPDLLINCCIDYYRLKGPEELQREINEGKFDTKK